MLAYCGLSLILAVATLAASVPKNFDKPTFRIVGGDPADIRHNPHQVSLQVYNSHICGGSIIKADCILTAAHCIGNYRADSFMIQAGSSKLYDANAVRRRGRGCIVHESYNKTSFENDVAILSLDAPLPLNGVTISTIDLATQAPQYGYWATATGWGDTSHGGYGSNELLTVNLPIINNDRCDAAYAKFGHLRIKESMICAGYEGVGGRGTCQGDSGGPLVCNGKLVGVVSWGYGCARPDAPAVFASVAYECDWIRRLL